uniref:BED-type domain-containing protein n=1 Tax=Amphimedon queenslandica TaxID=400682 RepID=A0A1X7SDU3_AMPQE
MAEAVNADTETVVVLREGSEEEENGRKRKYRSPIWNYFDKVEGNFAFCILCKVKYQHSNNTSNLSKHLQTKHSSEWALCEEERKVAESEKQKRKSLVNERANHSVSQPTLETVLERRTEYP